MQHDTNQPGEYNDYKQGRGAQINTNNKYIIHERTREHVEGIDDWIEPDVQTQFIDVYAKSIVNKV